MQKTMKCSIIRLMLIAVSNVISNALFQTYAFITCIVLLLVWIVRLEMRIRTLLGGKTAKSLEQSVITLHENTEKLNDFQREAISHFINVEKRLNRSIQAVETIRFNPFKGTGDGGNQSFSTAFVSENGNGAVISSLYSRNRISIFSKPLSKFTSNFELTEEEKETVGNAKKNLK